VEEGGGGRVELKLPRPPATEPAPELDDEESDDEPLDAFEPLPTVSPTEPLTEVTVPAIGARSFVSASAFSASTTLSSALLTEAVADATVVAEPEPEPLAEREPEPEPDEPEAARPEAERWAPAEDFDEGCFFVVVVVVGVVAVGAGLVVVGAGVVVVGAGVVVVTDGVVVSCTARTTSVGALAFSATVLTFEPSETVVALEAGALTVVPLASALVSSSSADCSVALASARSTSALLGSIFASSWPLLTCWPALT
jgi:hypothetical protein